MTTGLDDFLGWGMALVLISGAVAKLHDRADFALAVEAYELIPERLVPAFTRAFPLLELAAALLLIPTATRSVGVVLTLAVLGAATAAVIVNLQRGRRMIDCGCGGASGRQPISWWLVLRNAGLAAVTLVALFGPGLQLDLVGAVMGALAFVLLYAAGDQLLANGLRQAALRRPV
jgi:hypothetical protein